jgi:hypothetical protein
VKNSRQGVIRRALAAIRVPGSNDRNVADATVAGEGALTAVAAAEAAETADVDGSTVVVEEAVADTIAVITADMATRHSGGRN